MRRSSRETRSGFTLVELLVVIGVIALLIAILLPALSKARKQANTVRCLAQQKQLMNAFLLYSNEWKGAIPWTTSGWCGYPGWLYFGEQYSGDFDETDLKKGVFWDYLGVAKAYRCPSDPGPWPDGFVQRVTTYIMNASLNDLRFPDAGLPRCNTYKITRFKSDTAIFWEIGDASWLPFNSSRDGANFPWEGITVRHQNGTTISFLDGHAEVWDLDRFLAELNKDLSPLWRAPDHADGGRGGATWNKSNFSHSD